MASWIPVRVGVSLVATVLAVACETQSQPPSAPPTDREVAARVHRAFRNRPDFALVSVRGPRLLIDVKPDLHRNFIKDKTSGRKLLEGLTRQMQIASGRRVVEVWLLWDRQLFASSHVDESGRLVVWIE